MAKHGKKDWQTVEFSLETDIGTSGLAIKDAVANALTADVADSNFIATSLESTWGIILEQAAEPNGLSAISVGVAKGDYNAAEIEEWIENPSSFTRRNLVQQEIAKRMIKHIGTFQPRQVTSAQQVSESLNDGKPIKTRLNWRILSGDTINMWVYNGGEVAVVASAGQNVNTVGQINGFWED